MRGSLALPEFVPKTKGSRFGAMILDEERVFGESRRWERTLVRDQWRLSPKRSYSPKAFAKSDIDFAGIPGAVIRADHAALLHFVDDSCGATVTDAELAL